MGRISYALVIRSHMYGMICIRLNIAEVAGEQLVDACRIYKKKK